MFITFDTMCMPHASLKISHEMKVMISVDFRFIIQRHRIEGRVINFSNTEELFPIRRPKLSESLAQSRTMPTIVNMIRIS